MHTPSSQNPHFQVANMTWHRLCGCKHAGLKMLSCLCCWYDCGGGYACCVCTENSAALVLHLAEVRSLTTAEACKWPCAVHQQTGGAFLSWGVVGDPFGGA